MFYDVSGLSVSLALSKNLAFYVVWGPDCQRGAGKEKNDMLKAFEHRWAKFVVTMAQHKADLGQHRANRG